MYLSSYNLSANPFRIQTDPKLLWLGEKRLKALKSLIEGILKSKGIVLLSGDEGTGKKSLINCALRAIELEIMTAWIFNPEIGISEVYALLQNQFGATKKLEGRPSLINFLKESNKLNKKVLLIIDNADKMSSELYDELLYILKFGYENSKLLTVILLGDKALRETLIKKNGESIKQNIADQSELTPLTEVETEKYITHCLKVCGSKEEIFSAGAIHEIFNLSSGYFPAINRICENALLKGNINDLPLIGAEDIKNFGKDLILSTDLESEEDNHSDAIENNQEPDEAVISQIGGNNKVRAEDISDLELQLLFSTDIAPEEDNHSEAVENDQEPDEAVVSQIGDNNKVMAEDMNDLESQPLFPSDEEPEKDKTTDAGLNNREPESAPISKFRKNLKWIVLLLMIALIASGFYLWFEIIFPD